MCGIVAYCGPVQSSLAQQLVSCLAALEYRGYDSAGVLTLGNDHLNLVKMVGPVHLLAQRLREQPATEASIGMAHTRWATHGAADEEHAHPMFAAKGKIAIVMNGVVENDQVLRRNLKDSDHAIANSSDTATLAALIEWNFLNDHRDNLASACEAVLAAATGRLAFVAVHADDPHTLVVARRGSPMFIGRSGLALWFASDPDAFPEAVDDVFALKDCQSVSFSDGLISSDAASKMSPDAKYKEPQAFIANRQTDTPTTSTHFEKEIFEQEWTVSQAVDTGLALESLPSKASCHWQRAILLGCGSAHYACLAARLAFAQWAHLPADAILASEYQSIDALVDSNTLVVAVSQSGETADTIAATELAQNAGAHVIAVTNVLGSTLDRLANKTIALNVGRELSVASTKAYTAMLVRLSLLAAELGEKRRRLSRSEMHAVAAQARALGRAVGEAQKVRGAVEELANKWRDQQSFLFMGRGFDHVSALEGALKLRELSYRHTDGLAAGELKHGTIALIESGYPVIAIALERRSRAKTATAMREVQARGADTLALVTADDRDSQSISRQSISLPSVHDVWSPIVAAVPLQWLAFYMAQNLGRNVDRPRNLAKSVTVV